jgi:c(7)-type cytochrome triheme protein
MLPSNRTFRNGLLLLGTVLSLLVFLPALFPLNLLAQSTDEDLLVEEEEEDEDSQRPIAFNYLPKTDLGYIDWVAALKQGIINPKESLDPNYRPMPPIDFDVRFEFEANKNNVLFPHLPHTMWLDCRNCHPAIFRMQAGTNPVTMEKILRGEFCGRCHGVVAFPISDCDRCHSQPKPGK